MHKNKGAGHLVPKKAILREDRNFWPMVWLGGSKNWPDGKFGHILYSSLRILNLNQKQKSYYQFKVSLFPKLKKKRVYSWNNSLSLEVKGLLVQGCPEMLLKRNIFVIWREKIFLSPSAAPQKNSSKIIYSWFFIWERRKKQFHLFWAKVGRSEISIKMK